MLFEPALRIFWVIEGERFFREFKRMLCVEHDGKLFCARCILAGHDRSRMRAMRNPARMQCDRTAFDATTRSKISADIKQNLIRLYVVVHPRNLHCLGMIIEEARCESADDVTTNLKRLMDRWRLVHGSGDRLEILCVKREWIEITIPANCIERMMRKRHARETRTVFDQNIDIFLFVYRDQFRWRMEIALRIWRTHLNLTFVI